ncbi:MAG: hypothetical protein KGJ24_08980 [Burkholderiales bacterium]|nr:hypothetical protein [Burkholderiales bacterium]
MEGDLFSIDKCPKTLPLWEAIHNDLGRPPAERVARALGVGRSTVYRWHDQGSAPRMACLALFWLTRWGRSLTETQATNEAVLFHGLARALGEERDALRHLLKSIGAPDLGIQPVAWRDQVGQPEPGLNSTSGWPVIDPRALPATWPEPAQAGSAQRVDASSCSAP